MHDSFKQRSQDLKAHSQPPAGAFETAGLCLRLLAGIVHASPCLDIPGTIPVQAPFEWANRKRKNQVHARSNEQDL